MNYHNLKILVVEDTKLAQKTAVMALTSFKCKVIDIASCGKEAIAKLKINSYDIIFMDIGLPDTDGYTVTETIRNLEELPHQPIIVALTAHIKDESKQKSQDAGMNDFMSKPITAEKAGLVLKKFI